MADFAFSDVASKVTTPQQMSLGDMVNMARGAQAYQQAKQINPLLVRKTSAETQQQEQTAQTGEIDLAVAQQKNQERLALQDFMSKPDNWQTDGKVDMSKLNDAVTKIAPLTGPDVITKLASISTAQTNAKDAERKFTKTARENISNRLGILGRAGIQDPNAYINELNLAAKENPNDKDLIQFVNAQKDLIQHLPKGADIANAAVMKSQQLLEPTQQQEAFKPTAGTADLGGAVYTTLQQPSVGTKKPTITIANKLGNKTLSPQLASTIQGGLTVVGGGSGNGGVQNNTTSQSNPNPQTNAQPNAQPNAQQNAGNNLQPPPGMTKESYLATLNAPINNFRDAISRQNDKTNPNYIPDRMFNNKNVMGLLKDPEVDTQKIASYLSDPLKYKLLNPKEQELAKLMEQRVQGMKPGSVADLHSVQTALGTPNLSKETLMDLMRNEAGQLVTEDLLTRGRKNAGGNPNNPNAQAINNFDSAFQRYSSNPLLMKYIGIIGEGKGGWLDKTDNQALQKIYDKLPRDKNGSHVSAARQLEFERQGLLKLVNGGQ